MPDIDRQGHVTVIGVVDEVSEGNGNWRKIFVDVSHLLGELEIKPSQQKLLILTDSKVPQEGDELIVNLKLSRIQNKGNPGEFNAELYWRGKNVYHMAFLSESEFRILKPGQSSGLSRLRKKISKWMDGALEDSFSEDQKALIRALLLGDKTNLNPETKRQFASAGAMHVLAVSGLHVGILLEVLLFFLGRFPRWISKKKAVLISVLLIWAYAVFIGLPPSVTRAALMFSLLVIARIWSKNYAPLNILAFSALILLIIEPHWIFDLGFQLSYLAMFGILTLYKPIAELFFIRSKWLRKIWEGTAVGIAAQLGTIPLVLYHFHQFPNYFAVTNIGMMILVGAVLVFTLIYLAFQWIPYLQFALAWVLGLGLSAMIYLVTWIDSLPGAVSYGYVLTVPVVCIGYALLGLMLIDTRRRLVWTCSILGGFLAVQMARYDNITRNELIVFNSSKPQIAIKIGDQILGFYVEEKKNAEKLEKSLIDYQRCHPGDVRVQELKQGETVIEVEHGHVSFEVDEDWIFISTPRQEEYAMRRGYKNKLPEKKTLLSPWDEDDARTISLKNGAFRIPL